VQAVKPTEARTAPTTVIESARPNVSAFLSRAKILREQGQYGAALAELGRALAADAQNSDVQRELEQTRKACAAEIKMGLRSDC
jgi:Tfp pilus assembly protein PilF